MYWFESGSNRNRFPVLALPIEVTSSVTSPAAPALTYTTSIVATALVTNCPAQLVSWNFTGIAPRFFRKAVEPSGLIGGRKPEKLYSSSTRPSQSSSTPLQAISGTGKTVWVQVSGSVAQEVVPWRHAPKRPGTGHSMPDGLPSST